MKERCIMITSSSKLWLLRVFKCQNGVYSTWGWRHL